MKTTRNDYCPQCGVWTVAEIEQYDEGLTTHIEYVACGHVETHSLEG